MNQLNKMDVKRILFISWTSRNDRPYFDPSVRYRCFNFANEFIRRGHSASVISQVNFQKNYRSLPDYDAYIFHRPYLTQELVEFLLECADKKLVIADFDDFIFDVRHADMTPMVRVRGGDSKAARSYLAKTHDAASLIKNFTLSTVPLKAHVEEIFPGSQSIVTHNSIDPGFIGLSRIARRNHPLSHRPYILGYFSGTATHDKDFAMIASAVAKLLTETGGKILIVGPLQVPPELQLLGEQVVIQSLVSFHELASTMALCATVLAPLEDTVFTRSKSGLKFFEAVLAGCDVIATPIPDIDRFETPLLHKCRTLEDWDNALRAAKIEDPETRELEIQKIEELVAAAPQVDKWLETFMERTHA
jgi:hypothetical protein